MLWECGFLNLRGFKFGEKIKQLEIFIVILFAYFGVIKMRKGINFFLNLSLLVNKFSKGLINQSFFPFFSFGPLGGRDF
jgi:hypothetical protein